MNRMFSVAALTAATQGKQARQSAQRLQEASVEMTPLFGGWSTSHTEQSLGEWAWEREQAYWPIEEGMMHSEMDYHNSLWEIDMEHLDLLDATANNVDNMVENAMNEAYGVVGEFFASGGEDYLNAHGAAFE